MTAPRSRRALRMVSITVACVVLAGLATLAAADLTGTQVAAKPAPVRLVKPPTLTSAAALEQAAFDKINEVRVQHGLAPVRFAADLQAVARSHSEDQARRNTLTHSGSDGKNAGARLDAASIAWVRYGENVGLVKGYSDPVGAVVGAWMRSPGHAANVLDARLLESAIGVAQAADGTYFLTQEFVTR
ncbi:MAG: CAP domain-containing protein [Armatimonadetes bacterium]|nr:CAP domain-containing protein [Armatimonadota bacterium]